MGIKAKVLRAVGPIYRVLRYQTSQQANWYAHYSDKLNIKLNTIVYESRDGQSLTDSPLAIFKYLLATDQEKKYTHVWSYVKTKEVLTVIEQYSHHTNVIFVERNTKDYVKWLAQAQYLINNATFQPFFSTRKEQIYINTWHGTPLKTMGYDMPGNPSDARNVVRNFFQTKYLISPNNHTSEMFLDSYRLRGLYTGEVIESGYPRIDATLNTDAAYMYTFLERYNIKLDREKKNLIYTPTWKGVALSQARNDMEQIYAELSKLRNEHGEVYNVLVKVHPFLYKEAIKYKKILPYLIPDVTDTNELLSITDVLITDYSSIFFDYLVTNKPIIFYCWDDDLYDEERGKYFAYEELPGRVCYTMEEVSATLSDLPKYTKKFATNYQTFKEKFVPHDDGQVTKRYVDYIFNKNEVNPLLIHRTETSKQKLLFYPGGMRNNGITSSLVNLINNIDLERYELTCFFDVPRTKEQVANIEQLPKEVHLFFRFGSPNYTIKESYQDLWFHSFGVSNLTRKFYPEVAYQREIQRLLPNIEFDNAIDFSGYSLFWGKLILASNAKHRSCFLHSDMKADSNRVDNNKKIHKMNLRGLFSVYNKFDQLISVSESTREINQKSLNQYAAIDKFKVVPNTLNLSKILELPASSSVANTEVSSSMDQFTSRGLILGEQVAIDRWNKNPLTESAEQNELIINGATQEVVVIGEVVDQEAHYYKVLMGSEYIGWVQAQDVQLLPDEIVKKETVALIGALDTKRGVYLYTEPYNLAESQLISTSGYLRNIYVKVNEIVETTSGSYFRVVIKGQTLGWLNLSNIRFSKRLNKQATGLEKLMLKILTTLVFQKNHFDKRKTLKYLNERVLLTAEMDTLGKIKSDQQESLWGTSALENGNKAVKSADEVASGELVTVSRLEKTIYGESYYVTTAHNRRGWLASSAVELPDSQVVEVFSEELVSYYVQPRATVVNVFSDYLSGAFSSLEVSLKTVFEVTKKVTTTQNQTFLTVYDGHRELILLEEQCEVSESYGVMNNQETYVNFPREGEINFVTMGRLSPEKKQAELIRAFSLFYQEYQTGYLYIVGNGSLFEELAQLIVELDLQERVHLTGQLANPFRFLSKCSVFVLTSEYEGQPMVLLEAMTLGLKIISTDIPACRFVLEDGKYGLLTQTNDVAGIAQSMQQIYNENPLFSAFDFVSYNKKAVTEFYDSL